MKPLIAVSSSGESLKPDTRSVTISTQIPRACSA
jgi:hypothetical protein